MVLCHQPSGLIFADGFESGDTSAWSATVPLVAIRQLEREHRDVMERADRVLRETRRDRPGVADPSRDRSSIN